MVAAGRGGGPGRAGRPGRHGCHGDHPRGRAHGCRPPAGDTRARFLLYGHGCIGCNLYDSARLTPWGNVAVSLGGVLFTALLTVAAVLVLAWRGRPAWLPRWLLAEVIVICYGGDLVWQFVQAVQQLPVPAREPLGWGLGYTDLSAATSFGSQATGWSHETVAAIGVTAAALYTVALAVAIG
jgi:hypothetical protein